MVLAALVLVGLASLQETPPLPPLFNAEAVVVNAALTPDGEILVALDQEGTLYGWNRRTRKRLHVRRGIPRIRAERRLVCSADGRYLALSSKELPAGEREPEIASWETQVRMNFPDARWMESAMRKQRIELRVFSPDGRYGITTNKGGATLIWASTWDR